MPIDLFLVDSEKKRFKVEMVLDLTSLWNNGTLPLRITEIECAPCQFNGAVRLKIPELATWKIATKNDPAKLTLLLADLKIPGLIPTISMAESEGTITYDLQRFADKPESVAAWDLLIRRALGGQTKFSVGLADDKGFLVRSENALNFDVPQRDNRLGITALFTAGILAIIVAAGIRTKWQWIRDSYAIPDDVVPTAVRSFSLGRCQMLFWGVATAIAWFTIGWATRNWLSFNESALILMGISVGTAVGAVAATPAAITRLVETYSTARAAAAGNPADAALVAARAALANDGNIKTSGFLSDLTSDYGESTGLHRIQSIVFTILFGAYFVAQAFTQGEMPTLPPFMLALLGISGSAYVGFKLAGK